MKSSNTSNDANALRQNKSVKTRKSVRIATKELTYIALSVAILSVCAWVSIPFGEVPFTLQTFAVVLISVILGCKRSVPSVIIYTLLGLIGVPIFQGFKAGVTALAGATGGYIFGFVFVAFFTGIAKSIKTTSKARRFVTIFILSIIGLLFCYAFGTIWFVNVFTVKAQNSVSYASALLLCVVPYIAPDIVKITLAVIIGIRLENIVK